MYNLPQIPKEKPVLQEKEIEIHMDKSSFAKLAETRHSCRKYAQVAIAEETVQEMLRVAALAPASRGVNSTELLAVTDPETLARLAECKKSGSSFVGKAPLAIVVVADPSKSDVWVENASIVATYLFMEAEARGLGACWIQVRERKDKDGRDSEEVVKEVLGVERGKRVVCLITIGEK